MDGQKEQLSKTIQIKISDLTLPPGVPMTDTQRIEAAARAALGGDRYRLSIETVYDAVFIVDETGTVLDVNEKAKELFLYPVHEMGGHPIRDFLLGFEGPVLFQVVQNVRNGKRVLIEAFALRKDESTFPSETAVTKITTEGGRPLLCFFVRNVIHHKQAEEALRMAQSRMARAERLEAAGMVAGQIAHDFNNLLTPLLGYPALIRRLLPKDSPILEYLGIMESTAQDMAHLTEQLLCLSRRGRMGQDEIFVLNDAVQQTLLLLKTDMPAGIRVEERLATDLMPIKGSRDQIGRVIHNLCRNAIDAMGEAGLLRVTTENVYLEEKTGANSEIKTGEYVRLAVSDTGPGIPDDVKERMFDPFFTTKKTTRRRGSGLGLSIVLGIVKDHNGYVDFETQLGKGTTFYVYLPIHREETAEGSYPRGHETIVVMDDDALQVELLGQMLRSLGYTVEPCYTGEEAVLKMEKGTVKPDLAILDILVPGGMDGIEAMRRMRALSPGLPVLLISGMPRGEEKALRSGEAPFLRKPITIEMLATAVRAELDARTGGGSSAENPKAVLIVDDEEPMRKLFALILRSEFPDLQIEQAANGREALSLALLKRPRVMILDCQMPVMDGEQAFRELREQFTKRGWPLPHVLFCTGFTLPPSLRAAVEADSRHGYLPKPIQADVLIGEVGRRLKTA